MTSNSEKNSQVRGFFTPPAKWRPSRPVPVMPRSEKKPWSPANGRQTKNDLFHVIHKVPAGDSPYVKAKHVQVIDKDPGKAVSLFWAAINAGDRVDSALKDMAIVMKQLNRSDEAIEAIKSFRHLCPLESQESLDNVLIELYKRSGRVEEEIQMLQLKIKNIEDGIAFDRKRTKMARSQGKKVQITIEKEYSRLLGNLAWAHLQLEDYKSAEESYKKALSLELDKNKQCNLAICLIHLNKTAEAKFLLESVKASCRNEQMDESHVRSLERATQIMEELEVQKDVKPVALEESFCGEVQTPFPSGARRNLRGFEGDGNVDRRDLPGVEISNGSTYVHQNEVVPLHELKSTAGFWNHNESNPSFTGRENVKGRMNGGSRRNENQFINGQAVKYTSPVSHVGPPKDPFTQPLKCLWPFDGNQRRGRLAGEGVGGCNRKLSFEQHKDCENTQFVSNHNHERFLSASANRESKSAGRNVSRGHGRTSWKLPLKSIHIGESDGDILESDEQQNAADECKDKCNLPLGLSINSASLSMTQLYNVDCEKSSASTTADNVELTEAAKSDGQDKKISQQLTTNLEEFQEFSQRKKSWADMVEEDEQQELQTGADDLTDTWGFPSNKTFLHCRSPSKFSDEWKGREDFTDENYNTNIILQTPASVNQTPNLSKKIESLGLRDGYCTQPHHNTRSLNEHQKSGTPANCLSSPLQTRSLDFECDDSTSFKWDHATPNGGTKPMRRKRLQVFRNLTPESPRC